MAGLRQLAPQPHHLRHAQPGLQAALPADPVLPLRLAQPHDARGVLPVTVRRPGAGAKLLPRGAAATVLCDRARNAALGHAQGGPARRHRTKRGRG